MDRRRWEFVARAGHTLDGDRIPDIVWRICSGKPDLQYVYPIMSGPETVTRGPNKGQPRIWVGTNQPKTYSFTATEEEAERIQKEYGDHLVFIMDRKTRRYL